MFSNFLFFENEGKEIKKSENRKTFCFINISNLKKTWGNKKQKSTKRKDSENRNRFVLWFCKFLFIK